ncbi:hypothetical protein AS026_33705 [Rhizobium altiplani]|uniref:Sensor protein KdpD transmembrane domain-containing protein n=1 Tax=Rhizobium altiplani TaxID=1864509 RepID=A0A125Q980_9HYPH|nr:DUF4118 domain-containing protein [Rhizobium altiplani]KWV56525.1 hypothetical protein AS026_33705 [Rhizobium altiplani]
MSLNSELSQSATGAARTPDVANDLGLSDMPLLLQYLTSLVLAGLATAVAAGFDRYETIPNLSLIYVLPVVASSVAFGLGPALFSAVLGALAYNFFFTEPRFSLAVADTANIWAIVLLFVIGCITSTLVSSNRRNKSDLDRFHLHLGKLKAYTRQMIAATSVEQAKSITRATLAEALQRPVAIIYIGPDDEMEVVSDSSLTDMEIDAARAASGSNTLVAADVYPFDNSRFDFWPVPATVDQTIVIGVAFDPGRRPANVDVLMETVALILAATIERYKA